MTVHRRTGLRSVCCSSILQRAAAVPMKFNKFIYGSRLLLLLLLLLMMMMIDMCLPVRLPRIKTNEKDGLQRLLVRLAESRLLVTA